MDSFLWEICYIWSNWEMSVLASTVRAEILCMLRFGRGLVFGKRQRVPSHWQRASHADFVAKSGCNCRNGQTLSYAGAQATTVASPPSGSPQRPSGCPISSCTRSRFALSTEDSPVYWTFKHKILMILRHVLWTEYCTFSLNHTVESRIYVFPWYQHQYRLKCTI